MVKVDRRAVLPTVGLMLFAAFGVAYFGISSCVASTVGRNGDPSQGALLQDPDSQGPVTDFILKNVQPDNIRTFLRHLTTEPHLAGTAAELKTAQYTADTWRQQGLDDVSMVPYDVMLSYPDKSIPNMVRLVDTSSGSAVWESTPRQKPLYTPEEGMDEVPFNFNGYSATGNVTAPLVYVHYGRLEDFQYLETAGVTVRGRLVLARYGKIFRANIVQFAEERGALGVILFSDPQDYAPRGYDAVYPSTIMMPPSAVPLGTVKLADGDPLTPYYPAIDSAFHIPVEEAGIPKIPVQPISYEDVWTLLSSIEGPPGPPEWQGGLNVSYNVGPTPRNRNVNLDVLTSNQQTTIHNVIGVIRGSVEPDRYVLVGNHRDAWIFGAVDPSSGSAAMLELSRMFMQLHNETGWRPRRSIVFCSWAAEEYGWVGSVEWAEQFGKQLQDRAVAYLNVDMSMQGNYTLNTKSAPLLYDIVYKAAKMIPNPDPAEAAAGHASVYDTWVARRPDPGNASMPLMQLVTSGSDYKSMQHNLGVPSLDIRYTNDNETLGEPLYHTLYETFALVDELYDQGFFFHTAVTELWAQLTVMLSDQKIIPLSVGAYSDFISSAQVDLDNTYGDMIRARNLSLEYFLVAGAKFSADVKEFEQGLPLVDTNDELALRRINDQLLLVERSFIDPRGLPGRPDCNHVVFAPNQNNIYTGTAFAGLADALTAIASDPTADDVDATWRQFEEHLAVVTHLLNTAGAVLSDKLW